MCCADYICLAVVMILCASPFSYGLSRREIELLFFPLGKVAGTKCMSDFFSSNGS